MQVTRFCTLNSLLALLQLLPGGLHVVVQVRLVGDRRLHHSNRK